MSDIDNPNTQAQLAAFRDAFGGEPSALAVGPGRVNLIGEHTDYNDGFVLPAALQRDVRIALRPRADRTLVLRSMDYEDGLSIDLDALVKNEERALWGNYVAGVAWALGERGIELRGMDAVIIGNVPRASGLSSSAALEVASALALLHAAGQDDALDGPEIAKATQRAENEFVGVNSGIMDQFISVLGRADHALLIDCRSLSYELVPVPTNVSIVIGNTKASRSLASSAYNERRQECERGVAALQAAYPSIRALRDVSSAMLEAERARLDETVYRRCRHVVTENERVLAAVAAFKNNDLVRVGELMDSSHESLRVDYEVSSDALDAMVDAMRGTGGCYGARLTGAGFGGCAVALVEPGVEQLMADRIFEAYPQVTNIWPEVYTTPACDGARLVRLDGQ